jgi:predicted dehydrogenase
LNFVESSLSRRHPLGAWQYTIPPDASPQTIDWDRFLGRAPKVPFDPVRLFRWRNYRDYGTGIGGDLFVHQFTSLHFVTNSKGPSRVLSSGGLHFWKDGRDVPDLLLGLCDYPETNEHPAFNVCFRVNFTDGEVDQYGGDIWIYRFVGSEGVIQIDNGVVLKLKPPLKEPGYTIDTFPEAVQEQFLKEYRKKYPRLEPETRSVREERFLPPGGYRDRLDHFKNFFKAMRTREQVLEDAVMGFRAAAPALMANVSYFDNRICEWDAEAMKLKGTKS